MTVEVSCDALSLFRLVRHRGVSSPEQDPQWSCSPDVAFSRAKGCRAPASMCVLNEKLGQARERALRSESWCNRAFFGSDHAGRFLYVCVFFFCYFFFFAHGGWRLAFAAAEGRRNHFLLGKVSCGCCCCRWPGCLLSRQKLRAVLFA